MSKTVSFFLWFCLFAIPISYNFWGLDPALYSKFLLLDVVLIVAGIGGYKKLSSSIVIGRSAIIFFAAYFAYIILSLLSLAMWGINKPDGIFTWLELIVCPGMVLLLLAINQIAPIKSKEVSQIISTLAGVSILIGLVQYGFEIADNGWSISSSEVVKATFAHKNIFAEILLLTFPFSCYAGFYEKKKIHQLISLATIIMLCLLLSRAVWLGFGIGALVCGITYLIAQKKFTPGRIQTLTGIVVALLLSFSGYWILHHTGAGIKLLTFFHHRNTLSEREHLWSASWQIIQAHPILGSGLGSWKILNMRYGIMGLRNYSTFFQQPHNDMLWILSENGVLALIAACTAWLYLLYLLFGKIRLAPNDSFLYCLLFALVGYWVYSNFSFPKERAEHGIILAFIAFFILKNDRARIDLKIQLPRYLLLVISAVLVLPAWWAGNKLFDEIALRNFLEARQTNDLAAQQFYLDKINPVYFTLDGTATPISWYKGMIAFNQKNIEEATVDFDNAVKANPYHAYSLANVGTCLSLKGDKAGAENYFRQSLLFSPGFPEAALNLAAIKFNEKQTDSAAYYVGMAKDTLTNPRYRQFLTVVMKDILAGMEKTETDSFVLNRYQKISTNEPWLMHICSSAYVNKISVEEQVKQDVVWTVLHDDKNPVLSNRIKNYFKLAP